MNIEHMKYGLRQGCKTNFILPKSVKALKLANSKI